MIYRAVVAELVRALYSLELYTILEVEGSNPGVIYFRRLNKSKINAFGQGLRMRKLSAHAHKTSISGDDVIQPAYDVIDGLFSHAQVDGRLTC